MQRGQEWTKYGIFTLDGQVYGTFDATLGHRAIELQGQTVRMGWQADGKYLTCTAITEEPAVEEQSEADRQPGEEG